MKLFTLSEANAALSLVEPKLRQIQKLYSRIHRMREAASAAAGASSFGGGMAGGTEYVNSLYKVGKLTTELHELGVELKDHARGLVDFPSKRGDRVVMLCWQLGEGDQIGWWHEADAGFAGRKPL
jgi:hypothetical protein